MEFYAVSSMYLMNRLSSEAECSFFNHDKSPRDEEKLQAGPGSAREGVLEENEVFLGTAGNCCCLAACPGRNCRNFSAIGDATSEM